VAQSTKRLLPLALMFAAVSSSAHAQRFICTDVRPGDTAASLALRLTNNAETRHQAWFQIVDPVNARFVSKSAYDFILPGWRACLATNPPRGTQRTITVTPSAETPFLDRLATADLIGSWILVLAILTPFLALPVAKQYLDKRGRMLDSMTGFAAAFIREFGRPLPRLHPADRPVAVNLRCAPYRGRLEILVAPARGHSYPNLSDHRKNLCYDIERVLGVVPAQSFVCCEPYQRGNWVVIPFQRNRVVPPQEGAK
jgi:hypothetical protein